MLLKHDSLELNGPRRIASLLLVLALALAFAEVIQSEPASAESLRPWVATTPYSTRMSKPSCVASSAYIYCIGGHTGTDDSDAVYFASISPTGVGSWTATTAYPTRIAVHSCVLYSGYIYCIGGASRFDYLDAVYYAPFSSSGVGPWTPTKPYQIAVGDQSCAVGSGPLPATGYIYCVGGFTGSDYSDAVYYATISPLGLGSWKETTSYPNKISVQSCAISSAYIYCVGGFTGTEYSEAVYYAPLSPSGAGSWTQTASYPVAILNPSCTISSGYIYCVGGWTSYTSTSDSVYYAPISPTGVGSWTATEAYPTSIGDESCAVSSGYLYCVAGETGSAISNAVYYCQVITSPAPNTFATIQTASSYLLLAASIALAGGLVWNKLLREKSRRPAGS